MKGRIFAIEEFSAFDGPGIRTTVFLKGCPLKCPWCHNPEGQNFNVEYRRSINGCVNCKKCEKAGINENGKIIFTENSVKACERGLIKRCGEDVTPEELANRVLKNAVIFNGSGGGVTFSGGEPLAQAEFYTECAKIIGKKTSCALQTTGYVLPKVFEKTLEITDFYLYDLKLFDGEKHKEICGVDNGVILKNYKTLAKSGRGFVTRIPLIPDITDTDENLKQIAEFMRSCGVEYVELLPYNRAAGAKYSGLMREYKPPFDENKTPNVNKEIFKKNGIESKVL